MFSSQKLPRWLNFGIAFPVIFLNIWLIFLLWQYLQPIPSIVLTASLAAFLLDYPIIFLEQRGMTRTWAIALVLLFALALLTVIGLFLGPVVFQQLIEFGDRLPVWIEKGRKQLQTLDDQTILQNLPIDLSGLTIQLTNQISATLQSLTSRIINLTLDTINIAVNFLVTVVLTILLVLNGKKLWDGIFNWFPAKWSTRIQTSLQQSFQGYFAGQAIIALILSIVLSLTFEVLQVPFGLLFGLGIGIASIIPFGGTLSTTLVSLLLASQNIWLGIKVFVTALILIQINDNVVAPRLIGGITGLNPAIVVISILIGVKIGGFLGLLLAVPTASFIKKIADTLYNFVVTDEKVSQANQLQ
ncbi:MAG: AI-2E family transporter [Trichormus sp. ATA11-4-KO1]|jgi:predicted PurR-regulated permease PerM|nr:AI-2E family transporter [Trichormus sp. ATA11-4-KO1]